MNTSGQAEADADSGQQWDTLVDRWLQGREAFRLHCEQMNAMEAFEAFDSVHYARLLQLVPLVEAIRTRPALRAFYPFTSHAHLRLSKTPLDPASGVTSKARAEAIHEERFHLIRDVSQNGRWASQVITEGTAEEIADALAAFVADELQQEII